MELLSFKVLKHILSFHCPQSCFKKMDFVDATRSVYISCHAAVTVVSLYPPFLMSKF